MLPHGFNTSYRLSDTNTLLGVSRHTVSVRGVPAIHRIAEKGSSRHLPASGLRGSRRPPGICGLGDSQGGQPLFSYPLKAAGGLTLFCRRTRTTRSHSVRSLAAIVRACYCRVPSLMLHGERLKVPFTLPGSASVMSILTLMAHARLFGFAPSPRTVCL